ncbi:YbhB/YbcL family Raf kinase inhibitor-like protein [Roseiarcus sp.]|uniref:YbhB/YbcL family Raf kinase inhibitor-like protein n=1 Tax=Roseiarcus sp. TaxID=1969460 RepID=UPI003C376186
MSFESALGRLLRPVRAGESHLAWKDSRLAARRAFALASPAFEDGGMMPKRSAGSGIGDNLSPPLDWTGVPGDAAELALIVQDPDAPLPRPVTHLIAYGIDPVAGGVEEGALAAGGTGAIQLGRGSFRRVGYQGPRPVAGHGAHRYIFQMFALPRLLHFDSPPDLATVVAAMARAVLARGQLTGRYERP